MPPVAPFPPLVSPFVAFDLSHVACAFIIGPSCLLVEQGYRFHVHGIIFFYRNEDDQRSSLP